MHVFFFKKKLFFFLFDSLKIFSSRGKKKRNFLRKKMSSCSSVNMSAGAIPGFSTGGVQVQMQNHQILDVKYLSAVAKDPSGYDCTVKGCVSLVKNSASAGHFSQFSTLESCQKVCPCDLKK
jgi:hypothetical protein